MFNKVFHVIKIMDMINKIRHFDLANFVVNLPLIYHLRKLKHKIEFDFGSFARFFGVFNTYNQAMDYVPKGTPCSYADTDLSEINIDSFQEVHLFDYPILYWLSKASGEYKSIIDFGGHVGAKFYAYVTRIPELAQITWQVIEVPGMIKKGLEIAEWRSVKNLCFHNNISSSKPAEILFFSGVLQYMDVSIDDIVNKLKALPKYIFINKLPLHEGRDLWTIENFGDAKIPYGIFNRDAFQRLMKQIGYEKIDGWTIDYRHISIPFHEHALKTFRMEGQIWILQGPDMNLQDFNI